MHIITCSSDITRVGCFINVWAHNYLVSAPPNTCGISQINIKLSMAMYFSYFVLFAQFFYKAYLAPKAKGKRRKTSFLQSYFVFYSDNIIQDISQINIKLSMAMYFSYFVLFAQFFYKAYLAPKGISQINIKLSMAMYFSYFVLFAQFFYKAYLAPKGGKKAKSEPLPDNDISMEKQAAAINGLRQRNGVAAH
ncbi:GNS1/SUR4 family domain-containing protein [Phthorimaea operculella]|nr:GNS1/SUR4 family domain-containing protein [Phthorimaea operculella]